MLLVAAASRKLADGVGIFIERPPCYSPASNGPDVALAGF